MSTKPDKPSVTIHVHCAGTHLHQLFTGFGMLADSGHIRLALRGPHPLTRAHPSFYFLYVSVHPSRVNPAGMLLVFDMLDGDEFEHSPALDAATYYFKRSFHPDKVNALPASIRQKVLAYGLNCQVIRRSRNRFPSRFMLEMSSALMRPRTPPLARRKGAWRDILSSTLMPSNPKRTLLAVERLEQGPDSEVSQSVMFQCRLWEPHGLDPRNIEDAKEVNEGRIKLVRSLKQAFGQRFVGGLQSTAFARVLAPDLISQLPTQPLPYLQEMHKHQVLIASKGLLNSNGWKLAEYVAASRCIVSEPLHAQVPGHFEPGVNYLPWGNIEACLAACDRLLSDAGLAREMRHANARYYQNHLRPDQLVAHCLARAACLD
ncbi:MAG: glycosyltransferase family 1 protein [Chromatiales bacterium]|nr:glycosyltransferase family 1 protein [Chromatiales bacterium]